MRKQLLAAAAAISILAGSGIVLAQGTPTSPSTSPGQSSGSSASQQDTLPSQGAGSLGAAANGTTTPGPATCGPGSTAPTTPCPPMGESTARNPGGAPDTGKSGVAQPPAAKGGESTE
jgi:hypothetical protein